MKISRRGWIAGAAVGLPTAALATRWVRRRSVLVPAQFHEELAGGKRVLTSNGMPGHAIGDFPNNHDPVPIRPQQHRFEVPLAPSAAGQATDLSMWIFGLAVNGVVFDPSGPFWNRDTASGWQFEVLAPAAAVALGIDVNRAHTQGRGMYHYHGLPTGLLWRLCQPRSRRVQRPHGTDTRVPRRNLLLCTHRRLPIHPAPLSWHTRPELQARPPAGRVASAAARVDALSRGELRPQGFRAVCCLSVRISYTGPRGTSASSSSRAKMLS